MESGCWLQRFHCLSSACQKCTSQCLESSLKGSCPTKWQIWAKNWPLLEPTARHRVERVTWNSQDRIISIAQQKLCTKRKFENFRNFRKKLITRKPKNFFRAIAMQRHSKDAQFCADSESGVGFVWLCFNSAQRFLEQRKVLTQNMSRFH